MTIKRLDTGIIITEIDKTQVSINGIEDLRPARILAPANFIMVRATLKKPIPEDKDQNGHKIRPKTSSLKYKHINFRKKI